MSKIKKTLPSKYATLPKLITELVEKTGFSKIKVAIQLQVPKNVFNVYSECSDAYNLGIAMFSENLMEVVAEQMHYSASDRKYLMDKLNIHRESFKITKPTDSTSAKKMLGEAMVLYADGKIDENQLGVITRSIQAFSDLHTNVVLADKIEVLEKLFGERGVSNG